MARALATTTTTSASAAPKGETPEAVLSFWFDGEQSELYRSKWFPPEGSEKQRTMDQEIAARFGALLQRAEHGELAAWRATPEGMVALIVLLDQFSRHVYRQQPGDDTGDTPAPAARHPQLVANDAVARALSDELLSRGWHHGLPIPRFVFAMMPIRHTPTADGLLGLLETIDDRRQRHEEHAELLEKFRKTTQGRLAHLRGEVRVESDDDILERPLVETDESDLPQHRLYRAMHEYLVTMRAAEYTHLGVSLSGGVDSMVVAYLLHKLRPLHGDVVIVAVHLDYGNRSESAAECDYVRRWCARYGIIFHVRRIDEVKRATTKRDDYERISREIRYATYSEVMARYGIPGMCFGHHRGDVQENVISNMMKGLSLLNLNGMSASSLVNGVRIWRPLLAFDKDDIFAFAHRYGIPYFKDTTPEWSTRGKLRNHLVPLLRDMYGEGFLKNLSNLGAESTQCGELVDRAILGPILGSIGASEVAVWLDCARLADQPFFVWKEVLRTICHKHMGNAMVREKPIRELMMKLARHRGPATGDQWITLKKGNRSFLTAERVLILFRDRFFPKRVYAPAETPVELGAAAPKVFGPWTIETAVVPEDDPVVRRLQAGAVVTLWELVQSGRLEYALPLAESLVVAWEERPPTLRMKEKVVTDHIPLVTTRGARAPDGGFVRVQLSYRNGDCVQS